MGHHRGMNSSTSLSESAAAWDQRYAAHGRVWSAGPHELVAETVAALPPGRGLDLAGGEGRNSLWLAEHDWQMTMIDFSAVALDRAKAEARSRLAGRLDRLTVVLGDITTYDLTAQ